MMFVFSTNVQSMNLYQLTYAKNQFEIIFGAEKQLNFYKKLQTSETHSFVRDQLNKTLEVCLDRRKYFGFIGIQLDVVEK